MDAFLKGYWRALAALGVVERVLGIALIALIVAMITVQVGTRYALNRPIVWVEDLATFAFIWAAFLGAAVGLKEIRHIKIETFVDRLAPAVRATAQAGLYAIILLCCIALAVYAWGVMAVESRSYTISLPVNLPRHLFYSVPLFVGLASMALTSAYFILAHIEEARSGRPVDAQLALAALTAREHALDEAEAEIAERSLS
jgi:TRAP-type C4-dicarboxylate transport system permease small subunit